jgi:hypothetical protein
MAAATPAVIGAVWGIIQIVEKVSNWSLNRRKLEAEVKKLEAEAQEKQDRLPRWNAETFESHLKRRDAIQWYYQVQRRLWRSPVKIITTEIVVRRSVITIDDAEN